MANLDERIAATLEDNSNATSSDLASLIAEVEACAAAAEEAAEKERARSLDPTNADPSKSRAAAEQVESDFVLFLSMYPSPSREVRK